MNLISFSLVLTGVLLNAAAQLLLKTGTNAIGQFHFNVTNIVPIGLKIVGQPAIFGGLACYAVGVLVWIMALSRVEVSIAYPMLSIGYVVNIFAAWYLFDEVLSPAKFAAICLIIIGVYLIVKS